MKHISASQIRTFDHCNRKWFLERDPGAERTVGAAAERGKLIHSAIENALLNQDVTALDVDVCMSELVWVRELIAAGPVSADMVERRVWLEGFAFPVLGYIDLVLEPDDETLVIIDHKSTGNKAYIATEDELRVDPQAIIYSYAMALAYPAKTKFAFWHHCILTKGKPRDEIMVKVDFTRAEVMAFADLLAEKMAEMAAVYDIGVANSISGAYGKACWRYGRCAFFAACHGQRSPNDAVGLDAIFGALGAPEEDTMTTSVKIVYRDCLPSAGEPVPWSTFVKDVTAEYNAKAGVTNHIAVLYEQGIRSVADAVRLAVLNGKLAWPAAGVYVDSADPCGALFCAIAGADFVVVRAVR